MNLLMAAVASTSTIIPSDALRDDTIGRNGAEAPILPFFTKLPATASPRTNTPHDPIRYKYDDNANGHSLLKSSPPRSHTPSIPQHLKRLLTAIDDTEEQEDYQRTPKLPRIKQDDSVPSSPLIVPTPPPSASSSSNSPVRYAPPPPPTPPQAPSFYFQHPQSHQQHHFQPSYPNFIAPHHMQSYPRQRAQYVPPNHMDALAQHLPPHMYQPHIHHPMQPQMQLHTQPHPMPHPSVTMHQPPSNPQIVLYNPPTNNNPSNNINNDNNSDTTPFSPTDKVVVLTEELLTMRQAAAAHRLGMSSSALSKRWREVMKSRKWPYRIHCKLEKEIKDLLLQHKGPHRPPDVERKLNLLMEQKRENILPATIRL